MREESMTLAQRRRSLERAYDEKVDLVLYYNQKNELDHLFLPEETLYDIFGSYLKYCPETVEPAKFKQMIQEENNQFYHEIFILDDITLEHAFVPDFVLSEFQYLTLA